MCASCGERLKQYYKGSNAVWQRMNALYEANPELGSVAHVVFEDDNCELHHLYMAMGGIDTEQWLRRMCDAQHKPRVNFYNGYTDVQLAATQRALRELVGLGEQALGIGGHDEAA